jgi:orotidine-5'-phosphate decarboxylase
MKLLEIVGRKITKNERNEKEIRERKKKYEDLKP